MKQTPKHQDPQHIQRLRQKYGRLDRNRKEVVPNPEGGQEAFWFLYLGAMVLYIITLLNK
jgi:hypothetical protein